MKKPDTFFRKPYDMKNDYGPVGGGNRKNAPSFIYEILHGEAKFIRGRTIEHRQKIWNGISIDAHIPMDAVEKLSRMEEIELRSSCEGSGPERPTYLIFRFKDPNDIKKTETFVKAMNAFEDVKAGLITENNGLAQLRRSRLGDKTILDEFFRLRSIICSDGAISRREAAAQVGLL